MLSYTQFKDTTGTEFLKLGKGVCTQNQMGHRLFG